eukprot:472310_1
MNVRKKMKKMQMLVLNVDRMNIKLKIVHIKKKKVSISKQLKSYDEYKSRLQFYFGEECTSLNNIVKNVNLQMHTKCVQDINQLLVNHTSLYKWIKYQKVISGVMVQNNAFLSKYIQNHTLIRNKNTKNGIYRKAYVYFSYRGHDSNEKFTQQFQPA